MPSSYGIVDRLWKTLILLNAGPGDRVDLILDVDFRANRVTMQRYYEGIYGRVLFDDYKVVRIIFRTKNKWSIVTARSQQVLDRMEVQGMASFAMGCELMFLKSFEGAVKISRLGEEKDYYQGDICVVCHEEYKAGDMMAILACKHGYHVECIKNWLMVKFSCPICRVRVFHNPIYVDYVILNQHVNLTGRMT